MNSKVIKTEDAPKAIGPYSQGISLTTDGGEICFFSGQIAIDPKIGKLIDGDVVAQTVQIFKNITALLKSRNMAFENVVKTTVFLTDISDFAKVNTEYAKYFTSAPPARSCVQVAALPAGALVEIEVIACK